MNVRRVRITGGPFTSNVRVVDAETGKDLPVSEIEFGELLKVKLTTWAEVDVTAEAETQGVTRG